MPLQIPSTQHPAPSTRLAANAGIAIGPILFVIALLGVLAVAIASGTGDFGSASVSDRVFSDVVTQANLIRTKIFECNTKYGTDSNGDGFPASDANGTKVSELECEGDPTNQKNLWTGARATLFPPKTAGFDDWYYVNGGDTGGRCIWTQPSAAASSPIKAALTRVATKFSSQEVIYNSAGTTNRLVIWITTASGTPDTHCVSE